MGDRRLVIEPFIPNPAAPGLPHVGPMVIDATGDVKIWNYLKFEANNAPLPLSPGPDTGPLIYANDYNMFFRAGTSTGNQFVWESGDGVRIASMMIYPPNPFMFNFKGRVTAGALILDNPDGPGAANFAEVTPESHVGIYREDSEFNNPTISSILLKSVLSTPPAIGEGDTIYNAITHIFNSRDSLTEYARIDATGMTVLGLPVGGGGDLLPLVGGELAGALTIATTTNQLNLETLVAGQNITFNMTTMSGAAPRTWALEVMGIQYNEYLQINEGTGAVPRSANRESGSMLATAVPGRLLFQEPGLSQFPATISICEACCPIT